MSKYDDIKAKFAEIWDKLTSSEKQKLSEKLKNQIAEKWGKLKPSERKKLSERLKNGLADIKDELFLDKRKLVAMIFVFICMSVGTGAVADAYVTVGNELFRTKPLMNEVRFSSDFRSYERAIIVPLREEVVAGNLSTDEFLDVADGLSNRDGILNYIKNSGNEDWIERSEKVLTEDEYLNRLKIDGKIALVGLSGGFASAGIWRVIAEVDDYLKDKREEEDSWSL